MKTIIPRLLLPAALISAVIYGLPLAPPEFVPALHGIKLAAMAYLCIYMGVTLLIARHLVARRKLAISSIVQDSLKLVIVAAFTLYFLRNILHWNLAAILTPSAILTAIIGLAMQDTIGNFIAGLLIQTEKPFEINDWIEIEGQVGQVRELNWRYTKIETLDQYYVVLPNSKIATQKVVNYSKPTPEVNEFLTIGTSYDVPPIKVKRAVESILSANPLIIQDANSGVFLHEYADFSIVYKIKYAIRDYSQHRRIRDEVLSAVWYQFKKNSIEIPFPIRTVIMQPPTAPADNDQLAGFLAGLPFFEGVSRTGVANLIRFGLPRHYEPDQTIAEQGAAGDSMFFVLDGEFAVIRDHQEIASLSPGDCFGEMSLLTGERRNARITAKTGGRVLEIDRNAFKILLEGEPALMRRIDKVFEQRASQNRAAAGNGADYENIKRSMFARFKRLFGGA